LTFKDVLDDPIHMNDSKAIKNTKKYYQSCINEAIFESNGEEYLKETFRNQLAQWPMITPNYNEKKVDTMKSLIRYLKAGLPILFNISPGPHPKNPQKKTITVIIN
jgi:hypothetical protein